MKDDIFALLKEGQLPAPGRSELLALSLWRLAKYYLMFFTLIPDKFSSHYDAEEKSYLCLGAGVCPACAVGEKPTEHVYLPVWDVENCRVAALKFDTRPQGPVVKIGAFLKTYEPRLAEVVAVIECDGKGGGEFTITAHEPLPETNRGALVCQAFCDGLKAGAIDLRGCVKSLTAAQVAGLTSVKRKTACLVGRPAAPPPIAQHSAPVGAAVAADGPKGGA